MIRSVLISLVGVLGPSVVVNTTAAAQSDADSLAAQVDALVAQWDNPDSAGCTCAVMRDGEVVYSRAVGMANLELGVPLSPQSVLIVGSIAKQFTAASIALLALRGQLSLDDDVRKYVPELPDLGDTITIRHIVHHTSGLRGDDLRHFSGSWQRDYTSNARLLGVISRQRTRNFPVGEQHLYMGFGYIVLAEVVQRVSGQSLREFAEANIFSPLGMENTQFTDDYMSIVKNRAQSYANLQGSLHRFLWNTDRVGSSGLLSTAEDLLRWNRNFDSMTVGGPAFKELILTPGVVNSGDTTDYAFGFRHREFRGLRLLRWSGGSAGFNARMLRYPEQGFAVAVLCNSLTISAARLARQVTLIYLREEFQAAAMQRQASRNPEAVPVSTEELERVTGHYWTTDESSLVHVYLRDDTLRLSLGPGEESSPLVPLGSDQFFSLGMGGVWRFTAPFAQQPAQLSMVDQGERITTQSVEPLAGSPPELDGYLGTYYSEDADYEWVLRVTNDTLSMWDPRTWVELPLTPFATDMFHYRSWMYFRFTRDSQERIVGFTVNTERLRNLKFVRR